MPRESDRRINRRARLYRIMLSLLLTLGLSRLLPMSPLVVMGSSMAPSLLPYDVRLLDRSPVRAVPARGDIVVFEQEGDRMIKRIFGLPGEIVYEMWMTRGGAVYPIPPELAQRLLQERGYFTRRFSINEVRLREDEYYVLADNIEGLDSRAFGPIRHRDIIGICRPMTWKGVLAAVGGM